MPAPFTDAVALADLVRTGEASPLQLVDEAIARIEAINPALNAVIRDRFEQARSEADGDLPDGPFRGVPILFKDLGCEMAGEPLHEGMQFLKDHDYRPSETDGLAQRFIDAGFICIGRTNTPEIGLVPTTEPIWMILPWRTFIIPRSTPFASLNTALRLVAITASHSSSFMRRSRLSRVMPALLTRMVIAPN